MITMSFKKWVLPQIDKSIVSELAEECNVEPFVALLAYVRGYTDPFSLDMFIAKDVLDIDPFALNDMEKAVARINTAIESNEKITVYGDYDCDGVTSTALLVKFLRSLGADVDFYIPDRINDGYGMNCSAIKKISDNKTKLIITVDNGINAIEEIEYANSLNIDVVVTDHHIQTSNLPNAVAVVDPHRNDSVSEFKDFAGVGVVFNLIAAISGADPEVLLNDYSDLVAIGTVCDVMPLLNENRALVSSGVKKINTDPSLGVMAIFEAAGISKGNITAGNIAFSAGPRINALGRIANATEAVNLLLCEDYEKARGIAEYMNENNLKRQSLEKQIFTEACEEIIKKKSYKNRVITVAKDNWHEGVIGIVAARIAEKFSRPAVLFTINEKEGIAKASARSYGNFNLFSAVDSCKDLLIKYGGHSEAAGLCIKTENLDEFDLKINEYAEKGDFPIGEIKIDCKLNPVAVMPELVHTFSALEPFGVGNAKPVFGLFGLKISNITSLGNGEHTRLIVTKNNSTLALLMFRVKTEDFPFNVGDVIDAAVTIDVKEYRGEEQLSIIVKDIRPFGRNDDEELKNILMYEEFESGKISVSTAKSLAFTRKEAAVVYRAVKEGCNSKLKLKNKIKTLCAAKISVIIDSLEELSIIETSGTPDECKIKIVNGVKADLQSSKIYSDLKNMSEV